MFQKRGIFKALYLAQKFSILHIFFFYIFVNYALIRL